MRPLGLGCGKLKWMDFLLGRNLDALDALQLLDAALHLLGLGGLVAEAGDEGFELADPVLLVFVGGLKLRAALGLLLFVAGEAAGVEVQPLVPQLGDFAHGDVEEVAVVGDQDEGVGVGGEIAFEPVAGFQVEMIGGLVEKEDVGLGEEQLGEGDAHLPAAGELLGAALPIALGEAEAGKDGAGLGFDAVAVAGAELAFGALETVGYLGVLGAGGIEFGHAMGEHLLFLFERAQRRRKRSCTRRTRCGRKGKALPGEGNRE